MRRSIGLIPVGLALLTTAGAAQQIGYGPGRVLAVRQESYFLPRGMREASVVATETLMVVAPKALPAHGTRLEVELGGDAFRRVPVSIVRDTTGRFSGISVQDPDEVSATGEGAEFRMLPRLGAMVVEAGFWLCPPRQGIRSSWRDTLAYRLLIKPETLAVRRERSAQRTAHRPADGWAEVVASDQVTFIGSRRIETHLYRAGVHLRFEAHGTMRVRYLYASALGQIDSLSETGQLDAQIVYTQPDGRRDTVAGAFVLRRKAAWHADDQEARSARSAYFVEHGREPPDSAAVDRSPMQQAMLQGRRFPLDSLMDARARITDPLARRSTEELVRAALMDRDTTAARRFLARAEAPGSDPWLVQAALEYLQYGPVQGPLTIGMSSRLASLLTSLHAQRQGPLDREEAFAALLGVMMRSQAVDPAAAPALAAAARQADEPLSRDLLLLLAYMADPAANRAPLLARADRVRGYGPIARDYANGDADGLLLSWGAMEGIRGTRFPGMEAPWQEHRTYQDHGTIGRNAAYRVLDQWCRARGCNALEEFRRRFRAEASPDGRLVWAGYLDAMHDTTAVPWLRTLASSKSGRTREQALRLLDDHAVEVHDEQLITEIEELLLNYVATGGGLVDTLGNRLAPFTAHDERPDQRILVDRNLTAAIRQGWRRRFEILTEDSVLARSGRDGLQMATVISPVTKVLDRYRVQVNLEPFDRNNRTCLCGGGSNLELERRGGRWVVIANFQWVS